MRIPYSVYLRRGASHKFFFRKLIRSCRYSSDLTHPSHSSRFIAASSTAIEGARKSARWAGPVCNAISAVVEPDSTQSVAMPALRPNSTVRGEGAVRGMVVSHACIYEAGMKRVGKRRASGGVGK